MRQTKELIESVAVGFPVEKAVSNYLDVFKTMGALTLQAGISGAAHGISKIPRRAEKAAEKAVGKATDKLASMGKNALIGVGKAILGNKDKKIAEKIVNLSKLLGHKDLPPQVMKAQHETISYIEKRVADRTISKGKAMEMLDDVTAYVTDQIPGYGNPLHPVLSKIAEM